MYEKEITMRLALIGCGLIGTSATWSMKQAGAVDTVTAYNRHIESARRAVDIGAADFVAETMREAVQGADAVLIAVPVLAIRSVFEEIAPVLADTTVISDVGSVRGSVVADARQTLGNAVCNYCPVHPIAGGEKTGVDAAVPSLFIGANAIVTPLEETTESAHATWRKLWAATGANILEMTVAEHDSIFASVSHLPHVVAFALVDAVLSMDNAQRRLHLAGPGFRDTTRIAASSSTMWRDICLSNREALLESLTHYKASLEALTDAVDKADGRRIAEIFERSASARREI